MAVPTGTASMLDIQNEFGGSAPISLSEYYGITSGIPTSGTISINDFRGKSNLAISYVTASSETVTSGDQTHVFPTGIQAGDLLVMMQTIEMTTGDGYGPPDGGWGTGFTKAPSPFPSITEQVFYLSGLWSVLNTFISYKKATGSESGASIGGFMTPTSPWGSPYGKRRLIVFRPTFSYSTITANYSGQDGGSVASSSVAAHTLSASQTPTSGSPSCGVVIYTSPGASLSASISGGASSYANTEATSNNVYLQRSVFFGAYTTAIGASTVNFSGPSNTTTVDLLNTMQFVLS